MPSELPPSTFRPDNLTARPISPGAEARLFRPVQVLDHGHITLTDYMGNDSSIEEAARTSYQEGTRKRSETRGLIRYLMSHTHSTPFEMCEAKFLVRLPLFVAAQWVRHRTASINAESSRYSVMRDEFYIPADDQLQAQAQDNNQGRDGALGETERRYIQQLLSMAAQMDYAMYQDFLARGLARELARIGLSQNLYTTWVWKCDLHNLFNFLRLRTDGHAQWEIRQYANVIMDIVKAWVPLAHEAFVDYRLESRSFSRMEMEAVKLLIQSLVASNPGGEIKDLAALMCQNRGMSKREISDFLAKLEIK